LVKTAQLGVNCFNFYEAFHQRIGAADRIIDVQQAGFKTIISQPFVVTPGLPGHFAAKTVNHEYRFGMNELGHIGIDGSRVTPVRGGYLDRIAIGNTHLSGLISI